VGRTWLGRWIYEYMQLTPKRANAGKERLTHSAAEAATRLGLRPRPTQENPVHTRGDGAV